ncbi:WD40 repeat domain-containing protein [Streptosporangiaceae bacterium NEAU-GS5]|nr:WD40 repeat domain-containing protein [Streptosporangiaceae bacterium NEAU-GS5]
MRLPDPLRSCAVLIGTSSYESAELEDLPAVARNLTALHDVLTDPALGGLQPARCVVLADATDVHKVWTTLRRLADEATDTLLVYFAGHGLLEPHRYELCLALAGSHPADLPAGALPFEWIRRLFLDCRATYGVLVLDCCFSGRATGHLSGPEEVILGQIDIQGTYTLAAAGANQPALAPPGEEYTAFTGELLTLVHAGVPDGPELLTYADIYRHLLRTLTARGLPQPHQTNRGTAADLALTRNPTHPANTTRPRTRRTPRSDGAGRSIAVSATAITVIPAQEVHALAFSPEADSLAIAAGTKMVRVFDTATWRERFALRQQRLGLAHMFAVAFSPNGVSLTAGGYEWVGFLGSTSRAIVQHWNARTGQRFGRIICGDSDAETVHAIAYHPDSRRLATSSRTSTAKIWQYGQDTAIFTLAHGDAVQGVAFSPDGRWLATSSADKTARLWDIRNGQQHLTFSHEYHVRGVAFSPNGRLLATASTPAYLWNVETGARLRTLEPATTGAPLCHDVAFSPDGRLLAGAFIDRTVRIWDTHSGDELLNLTHQQEARVVRFSPDGQWLATGAHAWKGEGSSRAGAVHVWRLHL